MPASVSIPEIGGKIHSLLEVSDIMREELLLKLKRLQGAYRYGWLGFIGCVGAIGILGRYWRWFYLFFAFFAFFAFFGFFGLYGLKGIESLISHQGKDEGNKPV